MRERSHLGGLRLRHLTSSPIHLPSNSLTHLTLSCMVQEVLEHLRLVCFEVIFTGQDVKVWISASIVLIGGFSLLWGSSSTMEPSSLPSLQISEIDLWDPFEEQRQLSQVY
jgi:hypothetical protein